MQLLTSTISCFVVIMLWLIGFAYNKEQTIFSLSSSSPSPVDFSKDLISSGESGDAIECVQRCAKTSRCQVINFLDANSTCHLMSAVNVQERPSTISNFNSYVRRGEEPVKAKEENLTTQLTTKLTTKRTTRLTTKLTTQLTTQRTTQLTLKRTIQHTTELTTRLPLKMPDFKGSRAILIFIDKMKPKMIIASLLKINRLSASLEFLNAINTFPRTESSIAKLQHIKCSSRPVKATSIMLSVYGDKGWSKRGGFAAKDVCKRRTLLFCSAENDLTVIHHGKYDIASNDEPEYRLPFKNICETTRLNTVFKRLRTKV